MNRILIIVFVLLISAFVSCEYEPHGIYERYLVQNSLPPDIEIVELDLQPETDTVVLNYRRVYFHFESTNQDIKWVKFYLDDELIGTVGSGNSYFDIQYYFLSSGYQRLKLEIFTGSGTGSIADSLGAEGFLFSTKEWVIRVLDAEFSNVTTTESDGFLKLRWPPVTGKSPEFIIYLESYEIGRTFSCEFSDKGYVGQGATYYVRYIDSANNNILTTYGWVEIPEENRIKYACDSDNNYFITWEKPRYYAAVDTIVLVGYDNSNLILYIQRTTDVDQNSFEIPDSLFGRLRQYWMIPVPKYPNPLYSHSNSSLFATPKIACMVGYPSPIFDRFYRINSTEFIYHTSMYDHGSTSYRDSIFRYSTTENRIVDRVGEANPDPYVTGDYFINPAVSPDGSFFTARIRFKQTAIVGSAHNLNDYKIADISNITNPSIVATMPVSNTGTGIIISSDQKHLYDFKNENLLGSINSTIWMSDHNISPDGEYFYLRAQSTIWLYSYRNGIITLERTIYSGDTPSFDYFSFVADESSMAAGWDGSTNTFYIVRCSDMGIVSSFTVDEEQVLDVDFYNNMILSFSPYLLVVRNLTDGSLLYEIPVSFTNVWIGMFNICGSSVFNKDGARYFLK